MQGIYYLGMLTYLIGALGLCCIMLFFGFFLGGRSYSRYKNIPFESGIASVGNARMQFSIRFYLIAMVFVIFDLEGVYLYIWSVSIRETGWIGLCEVCIFIFILLISLIYLVRIGLFNWINNPLKRYDCSHCVNDNIKNY